MYKLFIDDIRQSPDDKWLVTRNYQETIQILTEYKCPTFISFDHDLGEDKSGMDFAKWLVEYDMDHNIINTDNFSFVVHSANPVGKENIEGLLGAYLKIKDLNS